MTLPSELYRQKVAKNELHSDEVQLKLLPLFDDFVESLSQDITVGAYKGLPAWQYQHKSKGLYLFGTVGRGKSMLMQLIFDALPFQEKRRVHFHPFMEEIHERMQHTQVEKGVDLMHKIASDISLETKVLCFDEFYVTNIGDAMLLGRLLEALFNSGVVLCATSNWSAEDLYQDGHNRSRFMPFMKMINAHLQSVDLEKGQDWRMTKGEAKTTNAHCAADVFNEVKATDFPLGYFALKAQAQEDRKIWFKFEDLCGQNIGRGEFMELANQVDTLVLSDMISLNEKADMAMRFVVLVDIFYELQKQILLFSEIPLKDLCTQGQAAFAFERTLSRLHEMGVR